MKRLNETAIVILALLVLGACDSKKKKDTTKVVPSTARQSDEIVVPGGMDDRLRRPINADRVKERDAEETIVLRGFTEEEAHAIGRRIPPPPVTSSVNDTPLKAYAYRYNSRIFTSPSKSARTLGIFRRGSWLAARKKVDGDGCDGGTWYQLETQGYSCTSDGVKVFTDIPEDAITSKLPDTQSPLPHPYAVVTSDRVPLMGRLPDKREHLQMEKARQGDRPWPKPMEKLMIGAYLVGLDRKIETEYGDFWKTVRGHTIYDKDLADKPLPPMVGVELLKSEDLPIAFTYEQDPTPVYRQTEAGMTVVGRAEKHARIKVEKRVEVDGVSYVMAGDMGIPETRVRIAARLDTRPSRIPDDAKWIHLDLTQQTLIAYEGNTPVYATLISSGKPGWDTPRGTFRVEKKLITGRMSGRDPREGVYDVGEVPWILYYFKSYAVHGAYWHNDFGNVRSHGCTNVSPVDAKWLFNWADPPLPDRWHGIYLQKGTWIHLTR